MILLICLFTNEYYRKKSNFYFHLNNDLYCLHMHIFLKIESHSSRKHRHIFKYTLFHQL